jgi:pectate lyase
MAKNEKVLIRIFSSITIGILLTVLFINSIEVSAAEKKPIGWASYNELGQNGTTGGAGGETVTVSTQAELEKYANASGKYIIYVSGTIDLSPKGTAIQVSSDKTILGKGSGATLNYGGLQMKGTKDSPVKNIIIRNLTIKDTYVEGDWDGKTEPWDGINAEQAHHIWIDHCSISHHADGGCDIVKNSNYVTISWCVFSNHNKTMGIGTSNVDTDQTKVTIHHNWFNEVNQRNPRVNNGLVHVFNNYYTNVGNKGGYVSNVEKNGELNFEYNYVENCPKTLLMGDNTANIYELNNTWVNSGAPTTGGSVFDPAEFYKYSPDTATNIPSIVKNGAGMGKISF